MPSVFALVSKGEFEKQYPRAKEGDVLPLAAYTSENKALEPLARGGDLYLVTVRPGEVLWLMAVLRAPRKAKGAWRASENVVRVVDARKVLPKLRFASGKGIQVEPGKLGMSLQTPRALTDDDVQALEALAGGVAPARPSAPARAAPIAASPTIPVSAATTTGAAARGAPIGTPWATAVARPAEVPADASYDAIDDRWVQGTRDPDGTRQGPWKEWRADGSLYIDTHYVGGYIHGVQRETHPDGSPAGDARWVGGIQKESLRIRPRSGDAEAFWKTADARVVSVESIPDEHGFGWRTGILRDAAGVEVTSAGEPVPARPPGVPQTARLYVEEGPPAWVDVGSQYTTLAPIGLKRVWSAAGELMSEVEYTAKGRWIWQREVLDPDPRPAWIDAFFAEPTEFSPMYELGQHWTPERHAEVRARLQTSSTRHVAAYLELLEERVESHLAALAKDGLTACGFEVTDDWLARGAAVRKDDGAADILRWLLAKRLERHERALVAELVPMARGVFEKNEADAELLRDADALVKGTADRELDKLASSRADWTVEDVLRLSRRALQRSGLRVRLGDPAHGDVLLLDETNRPFVFDGQTFSPAPVEVYTPDDDTAVHFQYVDTCDERRLFVSGEHVWWSLARYGWMLHLQGSRYFADRGQAEVILSSIVRCHDRAWVDRVTAMFRAMLPSKAAEVDPFFDGKKGWLFARAYRASHRETHGAALSRAVWGHTIFKCTASPGVLRLEMREKKKGAVPKVVSEHGSAEEARERFSRFEAELFRNGYELERVVALPVGVPAPTTKKPEKAETKLPAPKVPVKLDVAERVTADLRRAASAKTLSAKLAALRDAWQRRPVVALATALDTLALAASPRAEIAGKTKPAMTKWDELAETPDAAMLGPLLATLIDVPSTVAQPRIEQLATWPTDPRFDRTLVAIATEVPFTSSGTQSVWRRIFGRLGVSQDARILEPLRELPAIYKKKWKTVTGAWAIEQVEKLLASRAETLAALGALALHEEDQALLDALLADTSMPAAAAKSDKEALLAAVFAAPEDAARRAAYAAKEKDVRAEHIRLSAKGEALDKAGRERLAEIEREHIAELAGPLAKWIKKGARVRDGFLVRAAKTGNTLSAELAASPWWSTVEDLDTGYDEGLLRSPTLTSLRTLRGVRIDDETTELPVRPLVTVLEASIDSPANIGALFRAGTFPALSDLQIGLDRRARPDLSWLDEPVAQRLVRIEIVQDLDSTQTFIEPHGIREAHDRTGVTWLAELWNTAAASLPALAEIVGTLRYGVNVTLRMSRTAGGEGELSVRCGSRLHGWGKVLADNLAFLLDALGARGIGQVRLDLDRSDRDLVTSIDEAARLANVRVEWRARGK